jgi:hypothetical protein
VPTIEQEVVANNQQAMKLLAEGSPEAAFDTLRAVMQFLERIEPSTVSEEALLATMKIISLNNIGCCHKQYVNRPDIAIRA